MCLRLKKKSKITLKKVLFISNRTIELDVTKTTNIYYEHNIHLMFIDSINSAFNCFSERKFPEKKNKNKRKKKSILSIRILNKP